MPSGGNRWDTILLMSTPDILMDRAWTERTNHVLNYCLEKKKKSVAFPAIATGRRTYSISIAMMQKCI